MRIENQVCSLELSRKLQELGVKQESLWEYRQFYNNKELFWSKPVFVGKIPYKLGMADVGYNKCSAFTTTELGKMFPKDIKFDELLIGYNSSIKKWWIESFDEKETIIDADTEANARAKLLIYLKENKLL